MAPKRSVATPASHAEPMPDAEAAMMPDWLAQAVQQGVKPEQALAFIGLGLMRRMVDGGADLPWVWSEEEDGGSADLTALRHQLPHGHCPPTAASGPAAAPPAPEILPRSLLHPAHRSALLAAVDPSSRQITSCSQPMDPLQPTGYSRSQ